MRKKSLTIIALSVLLTIAVLILIYGVFQGFKVKEKINQLENDREQISREKEDVLIQFEECRNEVQTKQEELDRIKEDWNKIQKSCPGDSVCQGKIPFMRYKCNINGDAVNDGNKICECDQNCNLIIY